MIKQKALSISLISYRFLGLFSLMFFIQNCSKDPGPCGGQKTYYYLSEEDKAKVPYTGTDTLVFVSNTNDTAVCIGKGKKQFFTVDYIGGNPDCEPAEYYYEAYNYKFIDTNNLLNITLDIYKDDLVNNEIMEINANKYKLYPINLSFLIEKYNDDSLKVNNLIYPVNKIGSFIKYNLKKGIMYYDENGKIWILHN
jgi:hypothetical protein